MDAIKEKLANIHFENQMWYKELIFYREEIESYLSRFNDLVANQGHHNLMPELQQFQNHFIKKKEILEELIHYIKFHELKIAEMTKMNGALKEVADGGHEEMRKQLENFRAEFGELKSKFFRLLDKWIENNLKIKN